MVPAVAAPFATDLGTEAAAAMAVEGAAGQSDSVAANHADVVPAVDSVDEPVAEFYDDDDVAQNATMIQVDLAASAEVAVVVVAAVVAFVSPTSLGVLRQRFESVPPSRFDQLTKAAVPTAALEVVLPGRDHHRCYHQIRLAP